MSKYNSLVHNIKVQTWATKDKISNGLDNYIEQELFGGNVGHASIVMSLPINKETKQWIEQYCYEQTFEAYKATITDEDKRNSLTFEEYLNEAKQRIPAYRKKNITYAAQYNEKGELVKTDKVAYETEYFQVEFSWWGNAENTSFSLADTQKDMVEERKGRHFDFSDESFQFEKRKHSGLIGSKVMTYAPSSIIHQRDLSDTEAKIINISLRMEKIIEHLEVRTLLNMKTLQLKTPKIEGSFKLICDNIGLDSNQLVNDYLEKNPGEINLQQFEDFFLDSIEQHMDDLQIQLEQLQNEREELFKLNTMNERVIDSYLTLGIPPDHVVTLPHLTEGGRGLSPEAMLKKMRELTEPNAPKFDKKTNNCSKTITAILTAGAEHDPLLERTLSEEALGFFATPQQVIGNVQRARYIIDNNEKNTILSRIKIR